MMLSPLKTAAAICFIGAAAVDWWIVPPLVLRYAEPALIATGIALIVIAERRRAPARTTDAGRRLPSSIRGLALLVLIAGVILVAMWRPALRLRIETSRAALTRLVQDHLSGGATGRTCKWFQVQRVVIDGDKVYFSSVDADSTGSVGSLYCDLVRRSDELQLENWGWQEMCP